MALIPIPDSDMHRIAVAAMHAGDLTGAIAACLCGPGRIPPGRLSRIRWSDIKPLDSNPSLLAVTVSKGHDWRTFGNDRDIEIAHPARLRVLPRWASGILAGIAFMNPGLTGRVIPENSDAGNILRRAARAAGLAGVRPSLDMPVMAVPAAQALRTLDRKMTERQDT